VEDPGRLSRVELIRTRVARDDLPTEGFGGREGAVVGFFGRGRNVQRFEVGIRLAHDRDEFARVAHLASPIFLHDQGRGEGGRILEIGRDVVDGGCAPAGRGGAQHDDHQAESDHKTEQRALAGEGIAPAAREQDPDQARDHAEEPADQGAGGEDPKTDERRDEPQKGAEHPDQGHRGGDQGQDECDVGHRDLLEGFARAYHGPPCARGERRNRPVTRYGTGGSGSLSPGTGKERS